MPEYRARVRVTLTADVRIASDRPLTRERIDYAINGVMVTPGASAGESGPDGSIDVETGDGHLVAYNILDSDDDDEPESAASFAPRDRVLVTASAWRMEHRLHIPACEASRLVAETGVVTSVEESAHFGRQVFVVFANHDQWAFHPSDLRKED